MMTESVHLDRLHKRFGLTPSEGRLAVHLAMPVGAYLRLLGNVGRAIPGGPRSRLARRRWPACCAGACRGCDEHLTHSGDVVFRHACEMGLEGIDSKRLGSRYTSGRSKDWPKFKNPNAPAMKREAEEDWG